MILDFAILLAVWMAAGYGLAVLFGDYIFPAIAEREDD
jgi:hypothetical protein